MAESKEYILLARKGFRNEALKELPHQERMIGFKRPDGDIIKPKLAGGREVRIIHSIAADGPKLVEMDDLAAREVNLHPEVCALPVLKHPRPFTNWRRAGASGATLSPDLPLSAPEPTTHGERKVKIRVTEKKGGKRVTALNGLLVTAFSDFLAGKGDHQSTDDSGKVVLRLSGKTIERLYCEQSLGWGAFRKNIPLRSPMVLQLEPVSVGFTDCVRRYYGGQRKFNPDIGVTVGVLDTGVGPHDDLNLVGGFGAVMGEPHKDYGDVDFHGTFVAGIIGSRGKLYPDLRGLAPGVRIRSYRIFGQGAHATSHALYVAVYQANSDGCDILNMSIGEGGYDQALEKAIKDARDHGMLVVVAAGNGGRRAVSYPAACPGATAVSAMGCEGTFPDGALEEIAISRPPYSTVDPKEFIASFSNVGNLISVTGLGVGVLSTLPNNGYGECSGTSMAAPVVTGAAASLLSQTPGIYNMRRDCARSDAVEKLLFDNCLSRGFGPAFEGHGMPDPAKV